jgi:hypothetical protein
MAKPPLSVVPGTEGAEVYDLGRGPETVAQRVKRLQAEAHVLAHEEVQSLESLMTVVVEKAREIAKGGDAYPAGVRDIVERNAEEMESRAQTLSVVMERTFKA